MATTQRGIYYNDDVDDIADIEGDAKKQAESVDAALGVLDTEKASNFDLNEVLMELMSAEGNIQNLQNNKVDKVTGKGLSTEDYTTVEKEKLANTYTKPSGGIPKTDLDNSVQTSLGKADTAIQTHQDITGKEDKSNKVTELTEESTDTQYPSAKAVRNEIKDLKEENTALKQELKDTRNASYKIYTETPSTNVTLNKTSKNKFIKFGVNGNREQEGEPSPENECPIYAVGDNGNVNIGKCNKNKCNITAMYGRYFSNGIPGALASDTMIIDNFDSNNITFHSTVADYLVALTNIIKLQPNTECIIKFGRTTTATNNQWFIYDYDDGVYTINYRANNTNVLEKTFTTNSLGQIVLGFEYGNASGTTTISNIQIELGSTATTYTPHEEETFNIPCQKPMVDVADYFDWDNEQEVHEWTKLVLDGTENWIRGTNGTNPYYLYLGNAFVDEENVTVISNTFKGVSFVNRTVAENNIIYINSANNTVYIRNTSFENLADFKAYLAQQYANGTPVYIWYKLNENSIEKLPFTVEQKAVAEQIEKATSYYEQTNGYSNDPVSPIFDITAVGDQNLVIDSIDARLSLVE